MRDPFSRAEASCLSHSNSSKLLFAKASRWSPCLDSSMAATRHGSGTTCDPVDSTNLKRGGTLFDVGAHYGWMSIAAASCAGARGRVVAFEPSPVLLDVLEYHKRVNRLRQVHIVPAAVSNRDDRAMPFYLVNQGLSFRNSLTIGPDDTPFLSPKDKLRIDVICTTLDSCVK